MTKIDFTQAYQELKEMVWKLASRYAPIKEDREDLFQEIFININKALPKFRAEAALSTWAYRVAVNSSLNWIKRRSRFRALTNAFQSLRHPEAAEYEDAKEEHELEAPLKKLNARQRMILLMSDVEDKKLDEIAQMLRLPVGTVKSNLHRAREIVKKELNGNEGL